MCYSLPHTSESVTRYAVGAESDTVADTVADTAADTAADTLAENGEYFGFTRKNPRITQFFRSLLPGTLAGVSEKSPGFMRCLPGFRAFRVNGGHFSTGKFSVCAGQGVFWEFVDWGKTR
ncbi:hypothetical protein FYZ38_09690 [Mobiluncus curtisii]|nr:hypothetical protein [Mobiluncus curtisii]